MGAVASLTHVGEPADKPSYEDLEEQVKVLRAEVDRLRAELRERDVDRYEVPPHHR